MEPMLQWSRREILRSDLPPIRATSRLPHASWEGQALAHNHKPSKLGHGGDRWPDAQDPHRGLRRKSRRQAALDLGNVWLSAVLFGVIIWLGLTIATHGGAPW